jgi:aminoglycoside phosphotransferase (APT) family kinase protein
MPEIKPDTAIPIRPGEELPIPALEAYFNAQIPGFGAITQVTQFPGGYSNLTYALDAADHAYVLRRPPFGAKNIKGGHDMGREFRILSMLAQAGYRRIPKVLAFCEDEMVMDCPFYLMERVQGVILRGKHGSKAHLPSETMQRLSETLVDALVDLHAIDLQSSGLIKIGKPEGYIQRQVMGWSERYRKSQTDEIAEMEQLSAWLQANLPAEEKPSLLHNDYKYDNVVLDEGMNDIIALLDWEMATVGDPRMDLGTTLSYWVEASEGDFEKQFNLTWLPGNLSRQQVLERYEEKSGKKINNILYFYVFGLFKNAVVIQQIYSRYKQGFTQDERFALLIWGVRALSEKAVKALAKGAI